jgi:pyridoxine/pyridoxamine 5'-phosphate oxidase
MRPHEIVGSVIAANRFMTLATSDAQGRPWATPVWFATPDHRRFLWISSPTARHSRNLTTRPDVAIVIFDSTTASADRQAVYLEAAAAELTGADLQEGIETYDRASRAQGLTGLSRADVTEPAPHRLYQAVASAHFILEEDRDRRRRVPMPAVGSGGAP